MSKPMKGVSCITRNGAEYWYARVDGKKQYCGKGSKGRKLAEAARAKQVAKTYENREVAAGLKVKRVQFKSVNQMANWYMQLPKVQNQRGYYRKVSASSHLLGYFGNRPVHTIESDDIEGYRAYRTGSGAADATVNVEVALLSVMYNSARKAKKVQADMLPGEFPLVQSNNPRPIVTDEQFETLIANADPDFADVLVCGYESAMRSREICNLRAYQVRLDEERISNGKRVRVDFIDLGALDTKTGARRTVPVSAKLKEVLERRLEGLDPEDHVFTCTGKYGIYEPWSVSQKMRYLCKRSGIPQGDNLLNEKGERVGIVFHCLRHTRTTKWVDMGFSDEIVRRATGHKSLEAYQRYIKLDPSAVMRLVDSQDSKEDNPGIKSPQTLTGS